MRGLWFTLCGFVLMSFMVGRASAQMHEVGIQQMIPSCGMIGNHDMMRSRMMGGGMMEPGMPCPGMWCCAGMEKGMIRVAVCRPGMHTLTDASFYLSHGDELGLSEDQVQLLKSMQHSCQKETIQMNADFHMAMLELHNVLSEDEIDLSKAKELSRKVDSIQGEMRFKNIEAAVKARQVLSSEQLERIKDLGTGPQKEEGRSGCGGCR